METFRGPAVRLCRSICVLTERPDRFREGEVGGEIVSTQLLLLFLPAFVQAQVMLPAVPPSMTDSLRQAGSLTRQGKYREVE